MTRGELIRNARILKRLTQEDMADRLKISQQAYSNIESDLVINPRRTTLKMIGKILDIPLETLLIGPEWTAGMPSEGAMAMAQAYDNLDTEGQKKVMALLLKLTVQSSKNGTKEPESES